MVSDYLGTDIVPGDIIIYPGRAGNTVQLRMGYVTSVEEQKGEDWRGREVDASTVHVIAGDFYVDSHEFLNAIKAKLTVTRWIIKLDPWTHSVVVQSVLDAVKEKYPDLVQS